MRTGGTAEYNVGVQSLYFLCVVTVMAVTKIFVFKCQDMFSGVYTNEQQGNTNLVKGFSRVVRVRTRTHTHILC